MHPMHTWLVRPDRAADFTPSSPEEAVLVMLMQLGRRMRQRHASDQIDPASLPVLHVLRCCSDPVRVTELASRLHLDASTVSRQVRQLEDRGLLERTNDPDDGRASQVALLPEGQQALQDVLERRRSDIAQVLARWSAADRDQLRELLGRFAADLARANDQDETLTTSPERA